MQETHNRRGRIVSRRIDRKKILLDSFFRAFGLIQKHQKIKHGEKQRVTTPALFAVRSRRRRPAKTEYRGIRIVINHRCAKRTTDSALRKNGKKNGRRMRRRKRGRELVRVVFQAQAVGRFPSFSSCGHFWRHLLVPKGGKSVPRRKNRIEGEGILPEESIGKFFFA